MSWFSRYFVQLLSVCIAVSSEVFNFTAQIPGWRVDVVQNILALTFIRTGNVWHSPLFTVTSRLRKAREHLGGWSNQVVKEVRGGAACVRAGEHTEDTVVLHGHVAMPSGASETWTITLSSLGAPDNTLAFELRFENLHTGDMHSRPSDHSCPAHIQACYTYNSLDVSLLWELEAQERIVGAGEQFSTVDLRGQNFDIWSGEQGVGRGRLPLTPLVDFNVPFQGGNKHTTYSAVPSLLSTRGYGIVLSNSQLVGMDFTTSVAAATVSFEHHRPAAPIVLTGHILGGSNIRDLLPALTAITGKMEAPPAWVLDGLIVGTEGGHEVVSKQLDALVEAGVSVVGLWIQDWSGMVSTKRGDMVWWNWELDENRYPKSWLQSLSEKGIRVLTYVNPMLAAKSSSDGRPPNVFLEAQRLGHLLRDTAGAPLVTDNPLNGVPYGQVDILRTDSWQWWVDKLRCNVMFVCNEGDKPLVHGWMHDYGEQLLLNASVPSELGVASDVHNLYPHRNAAAAFAATAGFSNVTYFSRAGALQTPGLNRMFWLGDQLTSYDACDGLQSAVIGAMSSGLSGWTVTHTDLGGFTMVDEFNIPGIKFVRDAELLTRWLEVGVFINSMYRSHPGLVPHSSIQPWDTSMINYTKNLTELFRALRPYREALLADATQRGLPLVRHGLLVSPEDPTWFEYRRNQHVLQQLQCGAGFEIGLQQFFWGDDVIVAPVFAAGRDTVDVYIPSGNWAYLWTGRVLRGPQHAVWRAPLGRTAVFYRADGVSRWRQFFQGITSQFGGGESEPVVAQVIV